MNKQKYVKKPVVIEAYQTDIALDIPTLEGTMHASPGDYIITGVHGEQYPCKPDIFEETYEKVDDNADNSGKEIVVRMTGDHVKIKGGEYVCDLADYIRTYFSVRS